jgi:EAL domain-containing protein (putative c-di-GMP-specific phosphodiesterase class I)/GGDEF domain-containing protein
MYTGFETQFNSAAAAGLPMDMLRLALTSADSVLYRWNLETGGIEFSENIQEVFPFSLEIPTNENEWLTLIDPADHHKWHQQREHWLTHKISSSNYRYRLRQGEDTLWIRQSAVALDKGKVLVGVIYFRTQPAEEAIPAPSPARKPQIREGMKVSSVAVSHNKTDHFHDFVYPDEFVERLQEAIDIAQIRKQQGVLMILSIANFGMIINAFGHSGSEVVMHEISDEIHKLLSPQDGLYRIHRDQFGIILGDCTPQEIERQAEQISELIHQYGVNASVGSLHAICAMGSMFFPDGEAKAAEIIDKAYIALHKTSGSIHRMYSDGPDDKMLARQQMGLANYLRKAIQENKLRLAFQPIVASGGGKVEHYEVLLRLIGEDGKISSAGALIPIAERMGLIDLVDHMVLDMVVRELEQSPTVHLAMNVSNLTTDNMGWLHHFKSLLQDRPDIANRLMIEITETAAHRDLRRTAYFVATVQEMGCKVALDDFGSGYTSFRQLKALSVDYIKIDGSYVRDLADNPDNRFFVKTLLEFTKCFNLKSVAECVENGETAKMLMDLGVDYMQGYYFGKPENYRCWLV